MSEMLSGACLSNQHNDCRERIGDRRCTCTCHPPTRVPTPTGRIKKLIEHPPKLTRHERHQAAADAGFDTWDDYRGER